MTEQEREEFRGLNGWTLITKEMPYDPYSRWVDLQVMARDELRAAQADRNPQGHDPAEGHGRNDESRVAAGDAPTPNSIGEHHDRD